MEEKKIERFVEIGPSNTLSGLAKQTIATKYQDHDTALSIERQLLSVKTTEDEIYYKNAQTAEIPTQEAAKADTAPAAQAPVLKLAVLSSELAAVSAGQIVSAFKLSGATEDVPVKAEDIILTIIAQKLKKSIKDISVDSTIKALVGGMYSVHVTVLFFMKVS